MKSLPQPISFKLSEEEAGYIETMAREIFECPSRNNGRAFETVLNHVRRGVILEFALARLGAIKNEQEFDVTNRDTYAWDVEWQGHKAEVKCLSEPFQETKWVTFALNMFKTFFNNMRNDPFCVDIIIFGCYNESDDGTINVRWRLVAPAATFKQNIHKCSPKHKSNFTKSGELKYFYSHFSESRSTYIL
jgi:hypothetical protein